MRAVAAFVFLVPTAVFAQMSTRDLDARYEALAQAIRRADRPAFQKWVDRHTSKDFTYSDKGGRVFSRRDLLTSFQTLFATVEKVETATYRRVRLEAGKRTTSVTIDSHLVSLVKLSKDGPPTRVDVKSRTVDFWVFDGKEWRLRRKTTLTETTTMNGNPLGSPNNRPKVGRT